MVKKLMMLVMAVGALVAFAAPAMAQAETVLTQEETPLAAGSHVTATSINNLVTTLEGGPVLACGEVMLTLEVKANAPEPVLKQLGEAVTVGCGLFVGAPEPFPATITDGTLGVGEGSEIKFNGTGGAVTTAHFGADVPELGLVCTLDGAVTTQATNGTSTLDVAPSLLAGAGTPGCSNGTLEGSFQLETENGTPIEIDS
jgi:hypothetical protein